MAFCCPSTTSSSTLCELLQDLPTTVEVKTQYANLVLGRNVGNGVGVGSVVGKTVEDLRIESGTAFGFLLSVDYFFFNAL